MSPPLADQDPRLLFLQGEVARWRVLHEDLWERAVLMERTRHFASAQALFLRAERAGNELKGARRDLAAYISKRQKGMVKA